MAEYRVSGREYIPSRSVRPESPRVQSTPGRVYGQSSFYLNASGRQGATGYAVAERAPYLTGEERIFQQAKRAGYGGKPVVYGLGKYEDVVAKAASRNAIPVARMGVQPIRNMSVGMPAPSGKSAKGK